MSLPSAGQAVIDPAKIRDHLLSGVHPVGRFKAVFFASLGYSPERWEVLRDDFLALARAGTAVPGKASQYGRVLEVDGILTRTVWMVRAGEEFPRFVTAVPR